jgi:hypothetical protein
VLCSTAHSINHSHIGDGRAQHFSSCTHKNQVKQMVEQSSMLPPTSTGMVFDGLQAASTLEQVSSGRTSAQNKSWRKLLKLLTRFGIAVGKWVRTAANHYAATVVYEQLSQLSDAELQRRGLSRDCLARDALATRDLTDRTTG